MADASRGSAGPPLNRMIAAVLGLTGFFVSLYMLAYSLGYLGDVVCGTGDCARVQASQWCVLSAILITMIFVASLPEARRLRGRA